MLALVMALAVWRPASAHAQDTGARVELDGTEDGEHERTVNGHTFVPVDLVPWPFVTTRVTATTFAGALNLEVENLPFRGSDDGTVGVFGEVFDFGFAFTDWFALELGGQALIVSGLDEVTAYSSGANLAAGPRVGAVFRIYQDRLWYLGARLDLRWLVTEGILPSRLLEAVEIANGELTLQRPDISSEGRLLSAAPSVLIALAPAEWFGLQGAVTFNWRDAELNDRSDRASTIVGSVVAGFDLFGSPVRLELGPKIEHDLDELSSSTAQQVLFGPGGTRGFAELGLWYTGAPHLALGAIYTGALATDQERHRASIRLGYFW